MRKYTFRFSAILMAAVLFFSFLPLRAFASDFTSEIELEGAETFSLAVSDLHFFDFDDLSPGDVRRGKLLVTNTTDKDMDFSIVSIISYAKDDRLFDAMDLRISQNGKELYSGPYGGNGDTITDYVPIKARKEKTFDVEISFPSSSDNTLQGTEMKSIWTFESRTSEKGDTPDKGDTGDKGDRGDKGDKGEPGDAPGNNGDNGHKGNGENGSGNGNNGSGNTGSGDHGGSGNGNGGKGDKGWVKTGLDLTLSNSGFVIGLILVGLCLLATLITAIRICSAKKKNKDKK